MYRIVRRAQVPALGQVHEGIMTTFGVVGLFGMLIIVGLSAFALYN